MYEYSTRTCAWGHSRWSHEKLCKGAQFALFDCSGAREQLAAHRSERSVHLCVVGAETGARIMLMLLLLRSYLSRAAPAAAASTCATDGSGRERRTKRTRRSLWWGVTSRARLRLCLRLVCVWRAQCSARARTRAARAQSGRARESASARGGEEVREERGVQREAGANRAPQHTRGEQQLTHLQLRRTRTCTCRSPLPLCSKHQERTNEQCFNQKQKHLQLQSLRPSANDNEHIDQRMNDRSLVQWSGVFSRWTRTLHTVRSKLVE